MDPVFEALLQKLRARKEIADLTSVQLDQLNECLELLEKVSGDIQVYVDAIEHLKQKTEFFIEIAQNRRNRDLEIVLTTLAENYFMWWPAG
jgi:hypothetical protein